MGRDEPQVNNFVYLIWAKEAKYIKLLSDFNLKKNENAILTNSLKILVFLLLKQ